MNINCSKNKKAKTFIDCFKCYNLTDSQKKYKSRVLCKQDNITQDVVEDQNLFQTSKQLSIQF